MSDTQLSVYLPAYGNRLALRSFCSKTSSGKESDRVSLVDDLAKAIGGRKDKNTSRYGTTATYGGGNLNASKTTRKIELGWKHHFSSCRAEDYQQVRKKAGGGTRELSIAKTATRKDVLSKACELFFPDDMSPKGPLGDFILDIKDFKDGEVDPDTTISEMYDRTKLKILRFYLYTKASHDEVDNDELPNIVRSKRIRCSSPLLPELDSAHLDISSSSDISFGPFAPSGNNVDDTLPLDVPLNFLLDSYINDMLPDEFPPTHDFPPTHVASETVLLPASSTSETRIPSTAENEQAIPTTLPLFEPMMTTQTTMHRAIGTRETAMPTSAEGETTITSVIPLSESMIVTPTMTRTLSPTAPETSGITTTGMPDLHIAADSITKSHQVEMHRCRIAEELIHIFKDPEILHFPLQFKFHGERADDADGVSRDTYAEFWQSFLLRSAEGEKERVPLVSTRKGDEEWKALGRILCKGFQDHGYFPIGLSTAFIIALIYGRSEVTSDILMNSFLQYVTASEKDIIISAFDDRLDPNDEDEYADLLSRMGHDSIPKPNEVRAIMLQIAHKKLIQDNKFALDLMACTAADSLRLLLPDVQDLLNIYAEKMPSTRKVLNMLQASVENEVENKALNYLKKYIRSLDLLMLGKFLRFVTGADIISVPIIEVAFTKPQSIAARYPVAHTCGPLLEVPTTYPNYPDFRADFQLILESNYLQMDII